jgi:hypothetical protein
MHLRNQVALDCFHALAVAKEHGASFKALYIIGFVLFWPMSVLFLLSPVYGVLYGRVAYLITFGCVIVALGFLWLRTVQRTSEFVQSSLSIEERRRCILLYSAFGAAPALFYLPLIFWAPDWLLALSSLLAVSLVCSAILLGIALWTLHNVGIPLSMGGVWWLTPEILLVSCLALPILAEGMPVLIVSIATMAYCVRRWVVRHEFMIAASKYAPVIWYASIFTALGAVTAILARTDVVAAGMGAVLLGAMCWYWYSVFRYAYALMTVVAIIGIAGQ